MGDDGEGEGGGGGECGVGGAHVDGGLRVAVAEGQARGAPRGDGGARQGGAVGEVRRQRAVHRPHVHAERRAVRLRGEKHPEARHLACLQLDFRRRRGD